MIDSLQPQLAQLGIELTDTHKEQLQHYVKLLIKWNKAFNLIGKDTEQQIYLRHILDSLQLLPHIQNSKTVVDVGSGAGIPGIPLAICLAPQSVVLVEPRQNRVEFLKTVKRELNLINCDIKKDLIQNIPLENNTDYLVTARAVKKVDQILDWVKPNKNINYLLLKGKTYQKELKQIASKYSVTIKDSASITNPEARIIALQ